MYLLLNFREFPQSARFTSKYNSKKVKSIFEKRINISSFEELLILDYAIKRLLEKRVFLSSV